MGGQGLTQPRRLQVNMWAIFEVFFAYLRDSWHTDRPFSRAACLLETWVHRHGTGTLGSVVLPAGGAAATCIQYCTVRSAPPLLPPRPCRCKLLARRFI